MAIPKGFRYVEGIATPACGLVRDDSIILHFFIRSNL